MTPAHLILERVRMSLIPWEKEIIEKKMFGGTCFLFRNKICVGVYKDQLLVRVVSEKIEEVFLNRHATAMQFTGRKPMKEFVLVSEEGFKTREALDHWIHLGIEHATLKSEES